jgi:hypothetical protein
MKRLKSVLFPAAAGVLMLLAVSSVFASGAPAPPREERLLNGLRLLVWSDPASPKVTVRIRIHSGSAFDPQGREGTMQLLSDIIFPSETTREFFAEDLGGSLTVSCNYDFIEINGSGNAESFLTILETLSTALNNPQINKESTERVRVPLLARVRELEKNPAYTADQAVARRLFGTFPYGRPQLGSSESLQKVDFADVLLARQRFLTADNATVAITGNVKADFALKAAKRLFGGWLKSDNRIPATFARPEPPAAAVQVLETAAEGVSEVRFAFRGVARSDKDYHSARVLEIVLGERAARSGGRFDIASHFLPGIARFSVPGWNLASIRNADGTVAVPGFGILTELLANPVSTSEFESAKRAYADGFAKTRSDDHWLDSHTFRYPSVKDDVAAASAVTQASVEAVLARFRKEAAAGVLVVSAVKSAN